MKEEQIIYALKNGDPIRILGDDIAKNYEIKIKNDKKLNLSTLRIWRLYEDLYMDLKDHNENIIYSIPNEKIRLKVCLIGDEAKDFFYKMINLSEYPFFEYELKLGDYHLKKGIFEENNQIIAFDFTNSNF
ncbi:hypothetical protein [Paenimyroides viscosum]|uniref:Uncharacterized protein n=1 Tax=Paenimyroides viscosum TaxID=2488729 RepID=A0A3P1ATJ1_9FLAO|nr:hypothetical protein [Paenimyroides viscosum]RRA92020.1 hypothetical protein EG242_12160 [Paenimyroides viscosum]